MSIKETFYSLQAPAMIALVSDTHDRQPEKILSSLRARQPRLIIIPGDIVNGHRPPENSLFEDMNHNALPLLRACAEIAPTFFSLGNHECFISSGDLDLIRSTGVTLLDNEYVLFDDMVIGGLTSPFVMFYRRLHDPAASDPHDSITDRQLMSAANRDAADLYAPDLSWLPEFESQPGYRILLAHEPHLWEPYLRGRNIDLILSGHAHGGQWRFFGQGLYAPGQGLFPRYTSGIHENMVISRGLANNAAPFPRLFNPPELIYIT